MVDQVSFLFSTVSFDTALVFFSEYQTIVALMTPILLGEAGLYFFGILAGMEDGFYFAIILSIISIVFYEMILYIIVELVKGRHDIIRRIESIPLVRWVDKLFKKCKQQYPNNPMLLLLALKTLPMTKISILFFLLRYDMPLMSFLIKDFFITILWSIPTVVLGWLVGKGFLSYTEGRTLWKFILLFTISLLVMWFLGGYIQKALQYILKKILYRRTDTTE